MFSYLVRKQHFVIALGQFVSHKVVKGRSIEEINELDRYKLAFQFYEGIPTDYLEGSLPKEDIIEDIARDIDRRIPKAYIKWRDKRNDASPSRLPGRAVKGLRFHFKENVQR